MLSGARQAVFPGGRPRAISDSQDYRPRKRSRCAAVEAEANRRTAEQEQQAGEGEQGQLFVCFDGLGRRIPPRSRESTRRRLRGRNRSCSGPPLRAMPSLMHRAGASMAASAAAATSSATAAVANGEVGSAAQQQQSIQQQMQLLSVSGTLSQHASNSSSTAGSPLALRKRGSDSMLVAPLSARRLGVSAIPARRANPVPARHAVRLEWLPTEILLVVLEMLPVTDLLHAACVSRRLADVADHPSLWRVVNFSGCPPGTATDRTAELVFRAHGAAVTAVNMIGCGKITDASLGAMARHCPRLRRLCLQGCWAVTDAGVSQLGAVPTLTHVNLAACVSVTDVAVEALAAGCPGLQHLNLLSCYQVSGAGLDRLAGLSSLCLDACLRLSPERLCAAAAGWGSLTMLSLSACNIDDACLRAVAAGAPRLRCINLSLSSRITDAGVRDLVAGCRDLADVSLAGCSRLTDDAALHLASGSRAWRIDLSVNGNLTDAALLHLAALGPRLASLNVSSCPNLTGTHMRAFVERCSELLQLDVSGCWNLSAEAVLRLRHCRKLKSLNLAGMTHLTRGAIAALASAFPDLVELLLYSCSADDHTLLLVAACCSELRRLDVSYCGNVSAKGLLQILRRCPDVMQISALGCPRLEPNLLAPHLTSCLLMCQ